MDAEAQLWKSTTWGQGTACIFGQEALSSLATVLGMTGVQLTVLSLSHVDLGDTRMQLLCQGIARFETTLVPTMLPLLVLRRTVCVPKATDGKSTTPRLQMPPSRLLPP